MTTPPSVTRWRVESITCTDFKAFRKLDCRLNGRNLLLYGKNGSGKSSFYDALKLFVDSAKMPTDVISKRLGRGTTGLANIHAPAADTTSISIQLSNSNSETQKYTISQSEHGTRNTPHIIEAQLASDFITYRVLYDFYSTRHNDEVDLWPVFQREILPFCINSQLINVSKELQILRDMNAKQEEENYFNQIAAAKRELSNRAYNPDDDDSDNDDDDLGIRNRYLDQLAKVNDALVVVIQDLSRQADAFYQRYFGADQPLTLELGISDFEYRDGKLDEPIMSLKIRTSSGETPNPITFLNEAALTKIALSIRFGASLMMLSHDEKSTQVAGFKLLVIDDLLISLDMENRMRVIEILLSEAFADFQKIIMTHDKEFFKEINRRIYNQHTQWTIHEVDYKYKAKKSSGVKPWKTSLEKAEDYIYGHIDDDSDNFIDLDAAGLNMRKTAEELVKKYDAYMNNVKKNIKVHNEQIAKQFGLAKDIQSVIQYTMNKIHVDLYTEYLVSITQEELRLVIPDHVNDIENSQMMRIKELRTNLYRRISTTPWRLVRNLYVIQQLDLSRNRILNAAAHDNSTPQYESDFKETLELLKSFTRIVNEPDITAPLMRFESDRIEPIDPAPSKPIAPQPTQEHTPTPKNRTKINPKPTPAPSVPTAVAQSVQMPSVISPNDEKDMIELRAGTLAGHTNPRKEPLVFRRKQFPVMQQNILIARITQSDYYHQSVASDVPNLVAGMATFMNQNNQIKLAIALCVLIDIQNIMQIRAGVDGMFHAYTYLVRGDFNAVNVFRKHFQQFGLPESILTHDNFVLALKDIIRRYHNVYHEIIQYLRQNHIA
jgi:ABC-type multidrug transport system ATPase subunit